MKLNLYLIFLFCVSAIYSQTTVLDSADIILNLKDDTLKVSGLIRLAGAYSGIGEYDKALETAARTQTLSQKLNHPVGEAIAENIMGNANMFRGKYAVALDHYFASLKVAEKAQRPRNIANANMNIGIIYHYLKENAKALQYLHKALLIYSATNYTLGMANVSNSLGGVYADVKPDSGLFYYNRSLVLRKTLKDRRGEAGALNNIGMCYLQLKNYDKALTYLHQSLEIKKELGDLSGIGNTVMNIGDVLKGKKEFKAAEKKYKEGYTIARQTGSINNLNKSALGLSECYEKLNRPADALFYYKIAAMARDSIFNESDTKNTVQIEMNYEFEKKELARKAGEEKREALAKEEKRRQNIITASVSIGLGLSLVVVSLVLWILWQNKKKNKIIMVQKLEIEKQHGELQAKNKAIVDSIHYAKRIQQALLPNEKYIDKQLNKNKN
jgi:tetratricopeptide (TPR) repeat protein